SVVEGAGASAGAGSSAARAPGASSARRSTRGARGGRLGGGCGGRVGGAGRAARAGARGRRGPIAWRLSLAVGSGPGQERVVRLALRARRGVTFGTSPVASYRGCDDEAAARMPHVARRC